MLHFNFYAHFARKTFLFLLVGCCSFINLLASSHLKSDTSIIQVKTIETTKIESYRSDTEFIYDRIPPPPETPWESFKRWFWKQISKVIYSNEFSSFWSYFKWILIVVAIASVVIWIFKNELRGVFINKKPTNFSHFIAANENIHEMDFDTLIENAKNDKNFREAVRLSYLKVLKQLADNNLIDWKIDKTNIDYSVELANTKFQVSFNKVTHVFEYVWYGEFEIDSDQFNNTINEFKDLYNKLKK